MLPVIEKSDVGVVTKVMIFSINSEFRTTVSIFVNIEAQGRPEIIFAVLSFESKSGRSSVTVAVIIIIKIIKTPNLPLPSNQTIGCLCIC